MGKQLSKTDFLVFSYGRLIRFYLYLLTIFTIARLFFVLYFGSEILDAHKAEFLTAFFMGWKYDTLVISYFLTPIFLSYLFLSLLGKSPFYNFCQLLMRIYFVLISIFVIFILVCDLGFYSYFQDHLNVLFFGFFEDDTIALLKSIWKDYPLGAALVGVGIYIAFTIYLSTKIFRKIKWQDSYIKGGIKKFVTFSIVGFFLLAIGARGGIGELVLSPQYSDFSENEFINQSSLNGVYALERAMRVRRMRNKKDFSMAKAMGYQEVKIEQAFSDFLGMDVSYTKEKDFIHLVERRTPVNEKLKDEPVHVILFVMESHGGHWQKYNSEQFNFLGELSQHFNEDYHFPYFISSENGTIGSLISIAANIPPRPGKRYLSESEYMQIPVTSAAHIPFDLAGYETSFVYGGKLGWRDIGKYFRYQNYDNVMGENAIRKKLNLKGKQGTEWGLYDEHFFEHIFQQIKNANRPQFVLGLSTSNHPPFEVPKSFSKTKLTIPKKLSYRIAREKDLFMDRFYSFQYANAMLANFISKVKNSELANNTIIAVTGDHNFWGFINYKEEEHFIKYTVPFYLYLPKRLRIEQWDKSKLGSHEDIMPTLYNFALSDVEYMSFGEDLFSQTDSYAINTSIQAGDKGVFYKKKKYEWSQIPLIKKANKDLNLKELDTKYRSSLTIVDYYLKGLLEKRSGAKNDQQ